jgi:LuxR family transcriptional regulator, maltose regulon positive regulatory protein
MPGIQLLNTKITPPRLTGRILVRSRVTDILLDSLNYRLTHVQAGAGFGKSTALATLAQEHEQVIWYQISEEDADPLIFLLHFSLAIKQAIPDINGLPTSLLLEWDGNRGLIQPAAMIDYILNVINQDREKPILVVFDDVHLIAQNTDIAHILDRLIALAPQDYHFLLSSRVELQLPNLYRWKARSEVLIIDQAHLAFSPEEINILFSKKYGYELTPAEVEALTIATEGWVIALQLIWQNLRSGVVSTIEDAISHPNTSLEKLFEVLVREVFEKQPADIQEFLLSTAVLRVLLPKACDALRNSTDSASILAYLRRQELFVVDLADGNLRYHNIFQNFLESVLKSRLNDSDRAELHQRAASFFVKLNDLDSGIYHYVHAQDFSNAAQLLENYGVQLIAAGRMDTTTTFLNALPPEILHEFPMLIFIHGELARLHSRFQEALGWYRQAEDLWRNKGNTGEMSRALRGQARVYLDTVNPAKAEALLQQAIRLSDGTEDRESRSRLLELLAENRLNAGKLDEAEELRRQAEILRQESPSDSQLTFRVLLRTGRLTELRQKLEKSAETERQQPPLTPRAHRETLFLLSLLYSFQGEAELAYKTALEGTRRGQELDSPFGTAVGYMRQGHALMLLPEKNESNAARKQFENAIEISRLLSVPRLKVEAYWGLCRNYGFAGDLVRAQQAAEEGIEIARQAGDEWVASLIRVAMGGSLVLASRYEAAVEWLNLAIRGFEECSDIFGITVSRIWLSLCKYHQKDWEHLRHLLSSILADSEEQKYDFLFSQPTLTGPPDSRMLIPLLILARDRKWNGLYASHLLQSLGLAGINFHPGFQLKIFTLGNFQVFRGRELILTSGWQREKTRQLFQLLITYRDNPLDREQIFEFLWPDLEPNAANRNFKVALNTLFSVLEPDRSPGSESAYVVRQGAVYGLRPGADFYLDSQAFITQIRGVENHKNSSPDFLIGQLEQAISLYKGEYLPDTRYETWAAAERERLSVFFLQASDQLCGLYMQANLYQAAIEQCQQILALDNCWERAYRTLMIAYAALGDHGQVARTYQRCGETLRAELSVFPSPETQKLYIQLTTPA